jgi:hypothetical protein
MSPLYGEYISRIMRIAPETDAAAINIQTTTAAFSGANNPKLTKIGSAQEFVETRILGCFLKNDEFGLGDRHALGLQQ